MKRVDDLAMKSQILFINGGFKTNLRVPQEEIKKMFSKDEVREFTKAKILIPRINDYIFLPSGLLDDIDNKSDAFFKNLFSDKYLFVDFMHAIEKHFKIPTKNYDNLNNAPTEFSRSNGDKINMDVFYTDGKLTIDLEMQKKSSPALLARWQYYQSYNYSLQLNRKSYDNLLGVEQYLICFHNFQNPNKTGKWAEMHSTRLLKSDECQLDAFKYIFLYLGNFKKEERELNSHLEQWMFFFKNLNQPREYSKHIPKSILKAYRTIYSLSLDIEFMKSFRQAKEMFNQMEIQGLTQELKEKDREMKEKERQMKEEIERQMKEEIERTKIEKKMLKKERKEKEQLQKTLDELNKKMKEQEEYFKSKIKVHATENNKLRERILSNSNSNVSSNSNQNSKRNSELFKNLNRNTTDSDVSSYINPLPQIDSKRKLIKNNNDFLSRKTNADKKLELSDNHNHVKPKIKLYNFKKINLN